MPPQDSPYSRVNDLIRRPGQPEPVPGLRPELPPIPGQPEQRQVADQRAGQYRAQETLQGQTERFRGSNDYKSRNYQNPYDFLAQGHEIVKKEGIASPNTTNAYMAAIGAADRIDQRQVKLDKQNNERALADAEAKLREPQKYQLNAQQVAELQQQRLALLATKQALLEIGLAPATARANYALACIRSGDPNYLRIGENMLKNAIDIQHANDPQNKIANDPHFQRHYREAYEDRARRLGIEPVIPPIPEPSGRRPDNPVVRPDAPPVRPDAPGTVRPLDLERIMRDAQVDRMAAGSEPKWSFKDKQSGNDVELRGDKFFRKDNNQQLAPESVKLVLSIPTGTPDEMAATESRLRNRAGLALTGNARYEQFLANHKATKVEADNALTGENTKLLYRTKAGVEMEIVGVKDGALVVKKGERDFQEIRQIEEGGAIVLKVAPDKLAVATKADILGAMIGRLVIEGKSNIPDNVTPVQPNNPGSDNNQTPRPNPNDNTNKPGKPPYGLVDAGTFVGGGALGVLAQLGGQEFLRRRAINRMIREATPLISEGEPRIVFEEKGEPGKRGAEVEIKDGAFVRKSDGAPVNPENVRAVIQVPPGSQEQMAANELKLQNELAHRLQLREVGPANTDGFKLRVGNQADIGGERVTIVGGDAQHVVARTGQVTEGTDKISLNAADRANLNDVAIDGMEGRFVRDNTGKVFKVVEQGTAGEATAMVEMKGVKVLQPTDLPKLYETAKEAIPARPTAPTPTAAREVGPDAAEGRAKLKVGNEAEVGGRNVRVIGGDADGIVVKTGEVKVGAPNGTVYNPADAAYKPVKIDQGVTDGGTFVRNDKGEVFKVVDHNGHQELAPVSGVEAHTNSSPLVTELQRAMKPADTAPPPRPDATAPATGASEVGPEVGGGKVKVGLKVTIAGQEVTVIGGSSERVAVRTGTVAETSNVSTMSNTDVASSYHEITLYDNAGKPEAGKFVCNGEGKVFLLEAAGTGQSKLTQLSGIEAHGTGSRSPIWSGLHAEAARLRAAGTGDGTAGGRPEGAAFGPHDSVADAGLLRTRFAGEMVVQNGVLMLNGQSYDLVGQTAQEIQDKKAVIEEMKKALEQPIIDLNDPKNEGLKNALEARFGKLDNTKRDQIRAKLTQLQNETQTALNTLSDAHAKATDANPATRDIRPLESLVKEKFVQDRVAEEMARRGMGREGGGIRGRLGRFSAVVFVFSGLVAMSSRRAAAQPAGPNVPPVYAPLR